MLITDKVQISRYILPSQDTFQVPNLKTGRMEPLISALTEEEEEQFGNCIRRLNTLLQVPPRATCHV